MKVLKKRIMDLRAFIPGLESIHDIQRINFDINTVEVDLSNSTADYHEYDFDEVVILRNSGKKDKKGNLIYEGDKIIQWENNAVFLVEYDFNSCQFVGRLHSLDPFESNPLLIPLSVIINESESIEDLGSIYTGNFKDVSNIIKSDKILREED